MTSASGHSDLAKNFSVKRDHPWTSEMAPEMSSRKGDRDGERKGYGT